MHSRTSAPRPVPIVCWIVLALALTLAAHAVNAQASGRTGPPAEDRNLGFLVPIDLLPYLQVQALTVDGQVLRGEIRKFSSGSRGITRITLELEDGTKLHLGAGDLVRVTSTLTPKVRALMIIKATTTIEKAANTDWRQLENTNELIFDSVPWPSEKKRVLLLRLNSGFDHNFRVYALNNSREGVTSFGSIPAFGDEIKAHIVVRGDQPPLRIRKGDYRDYFETLYGDCPQMLQAYPKRQRDFSDFANHIAHYDRMCVPADSAQQARR